MSKSKINIILILLITACGTTKNNRVSERVVPIAINIISSDKYNLNFVNLDYYRLKVLDELDDFLSVDLDLVEPEENPEIILNINIENFRLWPRDERISRRNISKVIVVGRDPAGRNIYQTVRAIVDIVQVQRRSSANFQTNLSIKGNPPLTLKKSYSSTFNYLNTYVDNVRGDPRAVDLSLAARAPGFEPREDEFLFELSMRDMIPRLSNALRSHYNNKPNP